MPTEINKKIELEVVHVLFLDIVGYSKRLTNEQQTLIDQLNQVIRSSEEFQNAEAAGRLIKIPTGDGMALVFYKSPTQPVECALEISRALKTYPELRVRMGVHSGPVSTVTDLNDRTNAAGIGINVAQRVMDCGDAGHILLSKRVAEDLEQHGHWQPQLHDLGEVEVKHGVRVHVFNLYNKELGNSEVPEKLRQAKEQTASAVGGRSEELWVAVLPFKSSGDAEMESFTDGLGEDITTGLSRFRYLSVVANASAARLKGETGDERALGAKLGARYVLEGSIRKEGSGIRVTAQLVDTQTGAQLWAETYNRDLQASSIFAAQDDVAGRIVATVADSYGVLVHSMRVAIGRKDDADLTPVEWQFQYFAYREQITPSAHAALKTRLERAAERDARQSDLWACLAQIYVDEYAFGFQDDATSLDRALECANRVDVPGLFWPYLVMASVCGHLGRHAEAAAAVRDLLALDPEFAAHARSNVGTWHFASGLMDPILEGLRKAGLAIPENGSSDTPRRNETTTAKANRAKSGMDAEAARTDEGFWVAVLPFKYSGSNADLTSLAEGLTEDIVTGLSRFSYLKVIARSSTGRYANESVDIRSAGKELGARYVMEGSLRQAGAKLRLAVQLVDAVSGAHLWAENYERIFSPDAVFELQDELVPRIVSTIADHYGVLAHSMSESLRSKAPEQLSPYEAVLRSFGYYERPTPDEHATVRVGLERAVQQLPGYADGWAMLSIIYGEEYKYGFNARPDPLGRALEAARRATDAASSNHFAYLALAATLFFLKEFEAFRSAAERAVTLNPMDSGTIAYLGTLISLAGDWERGCALVDRAIQLNPKRPGWYWFPAFYNAYRKSDYRGALNVAVKINMPRFYATHLVTAAAYGQLGERDAASKALRELLVLWPDFGVSAREEMGKWFEPDLAEI